MSLVRTRSIFQAFNSSVFFHHQRRAISNTAKPKRRKLKKEIVPLDVFILNNQVKSLYRNIVRAIRSLPQDDGIKLELINYTKDEFTVNKNVSDMHTRRYLLSQGRKQFKDMTRSIGLSVPDHAFADLDI